jgi:glycine dehydrogenase subunit 1
MHKYLPHTKNDLEYMLNKIGVDSIDTLTAHIPKSLRYTKPYGIPNQLSDLELTKVLQNLSSKNKPLTIFRGFGAYDVYTPSIVKALTSRQEFLTSYTPYQPEVSQGTLQYIFEFQSMICEITGMDISNASMYDGPTATAEAMFMALAETKKQKVLISQTVNPRTIEILETYGKYRNVEFIEIPSSHGVTDFSELEFLLDDVAAVVLQNPNKYGHIENLDGIADLVHIKNALLILNQNPQSLALLKTPAEYGVDIVTGDLQSFGIPLSFGGAYAGYLATTKQLIRKMPGRICGVTTDVDGKRAFVLTLQAREQHIRRAKANSNICSNQSLMALSVAIYLSSLGKQGFIDIANLSLQGAYYLKNELLKNKMFEDIFKQVHYNEFTLKFNGDPLALDAYLVENGFLGPLHLGAGLLTFAVTEKRSKAEIDQFVKVVGAFK